jgi:hypothetical protein
MRIPMAAFVAAGLLVGACHGGDRQTAPSRNGQQPADVSVVLRTAQPQYPRGTAPKLDMVLRNNGSTTCKLPTSPVGSVDVVSVTRDGEVVVGAAGYATYYGGIGDVVDHSLKDVAPGAAVTAPLDIKALANSPAVLVVSQSTGAGVASLTSWKLDQAGHYKVSARLTPVAGTAETCVTSSQLVGVEFEVMP